MLEAFCFQGRPRAVHHLPGGHIHLSVLVECPTRRYVLQRLNTSVFPRPAVLMDVVRRVTTHLAGHEPRVPELVPTRDGAWCLPHGADRGAEQPLSAWRAFSYLEGTESATAGPDPTQAFEAARAFAAYASALEDLDGDTLPVTLPRFHDLRHRLDQLEAAVASDRVGRVASCRAEIDRARRLGREVADALGATTAPRRVVHNDAKLANARFDRASGRAVIIDLDTTMQGALAHDFGELLRTSSHGSGDDADPADPRLVPEVLAALAEGYVGVGRGLRLSELDQLAWGGPHLAVENGVRFLSDHLDGDRYFSLRHRGQNLERARTQLRVTEALLAALPDIASCLRRTATACGTLR